MSSRILIVFTTTPNQSNQKRCNGIVTIIKPPEDGEDSVVGGEGNGDPKAGRHEEEQEEGCPSAKPTGINFSNRCFQSLGIAKKGI